MMICVLPACPGAPERDIAKSQTRLDLAKDFLRKHQLEAATCLLYTSDAADE